jgi:uncharacterized protein (UPF0264 family)
MRPGLLVSVRSAEEAREALAGGADLIDVKEPSRGPLGSAEQGVIEQVLAAIAGRTPVSAALGELAEWKGGVVPEGVKFVKWGLANVGPDLHAILAMLVRWRGPGLPVLVAYADYRRANSPDPAVLAELACQLRFPAFLIDTGVKDTSTLLDWVEPAVLARIRFQLAYADVRVALAGSLGTTEIKALAPLAPEWFAVRGAACEGGRMGQVSSRRVRALTEVISAVQHRFHGD